jgi:hypothetical protein
MARKRPELMKKLREIGLINAWFDDANISEFDFGDEYINGTLDLRQQRKL